MADSQALEAEAETGLRKPIVDDALLHDPERQGQPSKPEASSSESSNMVTWDGADDPTNPKNWTYRRKWTVTLVVGAYTFISPISTSIVAPALSSIGTTLKIQSAFVLSLCLLIFILVYAFGPFLIGPLSEVYGRLLVLQLANLFYLVFNTACGFSHNTTQMVVFRFLAGLGGSAPFTIGGGILGDCSIAEERGRSIAIYTLAPLLGPVLGPVMGGFITERTSWRWTFWVVSIADGFVQVLGFLFPRETYAPSILGKKAQNLREATGDQALHTKSEPSGRTFSKMLKLALVRPFILLGTQPIIQVLAVYLGYLYGLVYLILTTFSALWTERYHQSIGIAGLNYISLGIGYLVGTQSTARLNDTIYQILKKRSGKEVGQPGFRLPLLVPGAVLVPAGLVWYGWSAQKRLHWIIPNIGMAIFGMGMKIATQCTQTYAVDTYTLYAASAGPAGTFLRSLAGFSFPLFAPYMHDTLGYGWGNSLLAFMAVLLGVPAPFLLWRCGPWLRARSQYAAGGLAAYLGEDPKSIPAVSGCNLYNNNLPVADKALIRTLVWFQVCAGLAASHRAGTQFTPVDGDRPFLYNLLLMMGKVDEATGEPDPTFLCNVQRVWALGADLGHTSSTSALLLAGSSLSDPLSSLISALSSGYGILHFGAAEASYKALAVVDKKENVPYLITKVKRREAKLFGYGHRMFNTIDPRIPFGMQILSDIDSKHPLTEVAMEIDRVAGKDEYFISRNLQANSDLFIGIVYTALDFDASMVPVMIALMRSGGMMAHWREAMSQPPCLWRPQQMYTGRVGLPPSDAPALTASDWNKEAPTSGHAETLFAEKAATKNSGPQKMARQTHAFPATAPAPAPAPAEVKIQLPPNVETLKFSNATTQAVISLTKKSDNNDETKEARVITLKTSQPPAEAVTEVSVKPTAQIAHFATAA